MEGLFDDDFEDYSENEEEWHSHRWMRDVMEEQYEADYKPEFSRMRPWHCRCVRNRTHPGKKRARREYLIKDVWYPVDSLPTELVDAIEKERRGIEATSDEDASSDEEPAVDPRTDARERARREAEWRKQEKRRKKEAARYEREHAKLQRELEAAREAEEVRRRACMTEEEKAAEDEYDRLIKVYEDGDYHLDPKEAHEAAVRAGDPAHCAADDEYYSWTIPELKELLEANDQLKGGNKATLVARCADGKLYGRLPRCPRCGGGKLKVWYESMSGHDGHGWYLCPGYYDDDEYVKCDFVGIDVTRPEWKQDDEGEVQTSKPEVQEEPALKRAKTSAPKAPADKAPTKVKPAKASVAKAAAENKAERGIQPPPRSAGSRVRVEKTLVRWTYSAERRRFSTTSGELRMVPVKLITTGEGAIVEFQGGKHAKLGTPAPGQRPLMSLE